MSHPKEAPASENLEFSWGKKRGIGGKKKEVQFYESFIFDGDEYCLFDCVYLYKDGEPEPYIGKIIKIWEQPQNKNKIKVLWFFRPKEVKNWLQDFEPQENEIFLASGEGVGLANINPVEAIAGKCNVVCTSKDSRNPQPSEEELRRADYVFCRTFNVATRTISDKIDDKIAGVEVKDLLNRKGGQTANGTDKLEVLQKKEKSNVVANNEAAPLVMKLTASGSLEDGTIDEKPCNSVIKENGDVKPSFVKQEPLAGGDLVSNTNLNLKETDATAFVQDASPVDESTLPMLVASPVAVTDVKEPKTSGRSVQKVQNKKKSKGLKENTSLDDRPFKKREVNSSTEKLQSSISPSSPVNKEKYENTTPKKRGRDSDEINVKDSGMADCASDEKSKSKLVKDSLEKSKGSFKVTESNEKLAKLSNGKRLRKAAAHSPEKNNVTDDKILEVTRRPDADRSKWFKGLPWEGRMESAYNQGTLVLLENFDPAYTSSEIEDIIWHGFRENCTARVVPRTAFSSPHSGQAFTIFKSRDAAEMAIRKLDEGCLLLPNGRPLIASRGIPPSSSGKPPVFPGHIVIDQIKRQLQREEMRQAVSTSHCSQPNTIEYEMAMEWCLLQKRTDSCWKDLYKGHGDEIRKLKANPKFK
ncbi:hypothetical protein Scep_007644 [Stephania cephalantha]|uniref:BAH domain-containing protein n=1 Tax=Stephania cephalantha TaxID=152367 RepID=A0AAP0KAG8_9MAGN